MNFTKSNSRIRPMRSQIIDKIFDLMHEDEKIFSLPCEYGYKYD